MNDEHQKELRCTFEDAERNNLLAGIRMSTRSKVELFEEMLDFAWHTGAVKAGRAKDIQDIEELRERENKRKSP